MHNEISRCRQEPFPRRIVRKLHRYSAFRKSGERQNANSAQNTQIAADECRAMAGLKLSARTPPSMNPNPMNIKADIARPITRPRISSSTIIWSNENVVVSHTPPAKPESARSTSEIGKLVEIAKSEYEAAIHRGDSVIISPFHGRSPIRNIPSAPTIAPAPQAAFMYPNPEGPTPSTSRA